VTAVDWVALAFVVFAAFAGLRRGLLTSALSAAGLVIGALLGARLAPHLLHGGSRSPYTPIAALAGACLLAVLLEMLGSFLGLTARQALRLTPARALDSAGGLVFGVVAGLAIVWIVAAVAAHLPGRTELRRAAQQSVIVRRLNRIAPPSHVLDVLVRIDPFPSIAGPSAPAAPPDPRVLKLPGVRRAFPSIVRVTGVACGLGVEGSGWIARPGLVVTAAHVVAGQRTPSVQTSTAARQLRATPVAFDSHNDVAVLRVRGLDAPPLRLAEPAEGVPVAILGFPNDGPFTAAAGRVGRTANVFTVDAYGHGPVTRTITSVSGEVRHGNSGGPAVDAQGRVRGTVFASRARVGGGFAVPDGPVRKALEHAGGRVSTGGCATG
jgi:S1-C subfamily serine protease